MLLSNLDIQEGPKKKMYPCEWGLSTKKKWSLLDYLHYSFIPPNKNKHLLSSITGVPEDGSIMADQFSNSMTFKDPDSSHLLIWSPSCIGFAFRLELHGQNIVATVPGIITVSDQTILIYFTF